MAPRQPSGSGVVFYESYYEAVRDLRDADRLSMYDAILDFGFKGVVADLPPHLKPLLILIMPNVSASKRRREASIANGKMGGAPKGNQNARKNNLKQPKNNPDKDIDTDIDIDTDTDNEIDKETDREKKTVELPPVWGNDEDGELPWQ